MVCEYHIWEFEWISSTQGSQHNKKKMAHSQITKKKNNKGSDKELDAFVWI